VLLVPLNLEVTTAEGSGGAKRALTGSNKSGGIRTFPSVGANGHEFPLTLNPEAAAAEAQEAQRERERRLGRCVEREREVGQRSEGAWVLGSAAFYGGSDFFSFWHWYQGEREKLFSPFPWQPATIQRHCERQELHLGFDIPHPCSICCFIFSCSYQIETEVNLVYSNISSIINSIFGMSSPPSDIVLPVVVLIPR
jgi:hypothetical protein